MVVHWTTHRGIYYLHMEQVLALHALIGFFLDVMFIATINYGHVGTTNVLSASVLDLIEDYRLVVYREVGSIPVLHYDIYSTTHIRFCILILRIYLITHRDFFFICRWNGLFFIFIFIFFICFFILFLWPGAVGGSVLYKPNENYVHRSIER
jgi:hypothetical protein